MQLHDVNKAQYSLLSVADFQELNTYYCHVNFVKN